MNKLLFASLVLLVFSGCAPTNTGELNKVESQQKILEKRVFALEQEKLRAVAELREETRGFQKKVKKSLANFRKAQQVFLEELNNLKRDIALITNDNEIGKNEARKNRVRLKRLEKRLGNQVIALSELNNYFKESIDLNQTGKAKDQIAFQKGFKLYKKKEFSSAEKTFLDFRLHFKDSDLVDDAVFLIGYIRFLQGQYERATLYFFELVEQYPDSNRLNETKWWLGVSLERSGDVNAALDIYRELTDLPAQNPLRVKAELRIEELSGDEKVE